MPSPKGRILFTDDNLDSREIAALILLNQGYEVVCSTNAANALELAESEPFDLFVFDTWMPGLSGFDLTRKVREFNPTTNSSRSHSLLAKSRSKTESVALFGSDLALHYCDGHNSFL